MHTGRPGEVISLTDEMNDAYCLRVMSCVFLAEGRSPNNLIGNLPPDCPGKELGTNVMWQSALPVTVIMTGV